MYIYSSINIYVYLYIYTYMYMIAGLFSWGGGRKTPNSYTTPGQAADNTQVGRSREFAQCIFHINEHCMKQLYFALHVPYKGTNFFPLFFLALE